MFIDLAVMFVLLLANGFFSLSEMAVVTARTARLKDLAESAGAGARGAQAALDLKARPGRFLSSVQIGITLVGIYAGAFGGTQMAAPLAALLDDMPPVAAYAEATALTIVVLIITFLTLLIGELIPKNLALAMPEALAVRVAAPMQMFSRLLSPGVFVLDRASALVLAVFGRSATDSERVTEEEIRHFVKEGAASGAIESHERDMIYRVIRLGDKIAGDLMIPRRMMTVLDLEAPFEATIETQRASPHVSFPVIRGDRANVIGTLSKADLAFRSPSTNEDLVAVMREPVYVPEATEAARLLDVLRPIPHQIAIVVDEYGTVEGLISLVDVLLAIVGAQGALGAVDLLPRGEVVRNDGSILVDGLKPAEDLRDLLHLRDLPGEEGVAYNTVAGMLIANTHTLQREGDAMEWEGWRFEVVDMDGARIDKVLITRIEPATSE